MHHQFFLRGGAAPPTITLSLVEGEDWEEPTVIVTLTGHVLSGAPPVLVGGVSATSIVRDSATQLTCVFPSRVLADTEDLLAVDVVVDGVTKTAAYTYLWSPHSAQIAALWDFRREVTHGATATAIANVGVGGSAFDLIPCTSAQPYNATDPNLDGKPSITMATGGYKTGTISIGNPVFMFAIIFPEHPATNFRGIMDGQALFQRFFYKDISSDRLAMYAGAVFLSTPTLIGASLVMCKWNGVNSEEYINSPTPEIGNPGASSTTTSLTIGEGGDRGGAYPFTREIAMIGAHTAALSSNMLERMVAFATRVYGTP